MDLRRDTFSGQDLFEQLHRRGVRRALCHIQDFNFHLELSGFRGFPSLKIGQ